MAKKHVAKKRYMSKGPKAALRTSQPASPASTFSMNVMVPPGGIELKLRDSSGHAVCTLLITQEGLRFAKAKAKKQPDRLLSWTVLNGLMVSGLL